MQSRERTIAIAIAAVLGAAGLYYGFDALSTAYGERDDRIAELNASIADAQQKTALAMRARKKIKAWEERALPADGNIARSLYGNWLHELVNDVGLEDNPSVKLADSGKAAPKGAPFQLHAFTVAGRGTWDQAARLLHGFYSAGHLHQLTNITLNPVAGTAKVDITMSIEAASMPGVSRKELTKAAGDRLAWTDVAHYSEALSKRDFFSPYAPPVVRTEPRERPTPTTPPKPDDAEFAFLTAIVEVRGRPQAWIKVRTTDVLLKLSEGESFAVGGVKGKLARIDPRVVEIEDGGQTRQIRLGDRLKPQE